MKLMPHVVSTVLNVNRKSENDKDLSAFYKKLCTHVSQKLPLEYPVDMFTLCDH